MPMPKTIQKHLDLTAQIKELQAEQKLLTVKIKAQMEKEETNFLKGMTNVGLKLVEAVAWKIKSAEVKEEMGEDWWTKRCSPSTSRSLRLSREDA